MSDYITYDFGVNTIYVSLVNGNQILLPTRADLSVQERKRILYENGMDEVIAIPGKYDRDLLKTIYISIHASSQCNLQCKYCFMKERMSENVSLVNAKRFIDLIVNEFPQAYKFIVDPSGSGEPLLKMDFIIALAEYCHQKSKEIGKEVLPMLVTNGTLLSRVYVEQLQSAGYIFGVSIDGYKKAHDEFRVNKQGQGTYDKVIRNIKNIKHKKFLGAAVTLTGAKTNLVKVVKHLYRYFPTISIKPVRRTTGSSIGICEENINTIKDEYTKLNEFVLSKTLQGNLEYLGALLNGDDYYGKFLLRVILNYKVSTRCDAGLGRFSLTPEMNIIACPGSIGIDDLVVGTLNQGLNYNKIDALWEMMIGRKNCVDCEARFVCGGECIVVSYYKSLKLDSVDQIMCDLKRHLFKLSVKFKFELMSKSEEHFYTVYDGCLIKMKRFGEAKDLSQKLMKEHGK
jgi:radical SAM protein with 4Fe4S-binding SPASM domain